jgi:receptor expression-enhancing protein 1/2/3/4
MYWTTLSLALAAESLLYPIPSWVPFYSWIRLGAHLYLVLPGQQGSVFVYQNYIHPFLYEHERDIDRFITSSHDKAKAAGLQYLKQGIEWVKVNLLGMQPRRPTPPASRNVSYSQSLLNRFVMPSARPEGYGGAASSATGANDLFSMLGNVMAQAAGPSGAPRSRDAQAKDLSASGNLVPPHMSGDERNAYISTQQDHLRTLLEAFNKEATREHTPASSSSSPPYPTNDGPGPNFQDFLRPAAEGLLNRSKSESEFEDLGYEHVSTGSNKPSPRLPERTGSWSKWVWGNYGEKDSAAGQKKND